MGITTLKDKLIGVVCGGISEEREVSLRSGKNVQVALDSLGYNTQLCDPKDTLSWMKDVDIAFLALHGQYGEDGSIQALFEAANLAYTGSRVQASVLGMDKWVCKQFLSMNGFPTAAYVLSDSAMKDVPPQLTFPLIVKPINQGSSVDVYIVDTPEELSEKTQSLSKKYGLFLVETFIEGVEISVGVLDMEVPTALPVLELRPKNRFYDYDAKYTPGKTEFVIPAELSEEVTQEVKDYAVKLHTKIGCKGMSRVDMIISPDKGPHILEINTLPGMTETSDLPAQAKAYGMSFETLVEWILRSAIT